MSPKPEEEVVKPLPFGTEIEADPKVFWCDQLNQRAREIAKIDPSPHWEQIRQGKDVYVTRFDLVVYIYTAFCFASIAYHVVAVGVMPTIVALLLVFVYSDFKGGLTHVVLDEPANISLPLLGDAALEFQMHHAIPRDNVIKPFIQMCGDLNVYVMASLLTLAYGSQAPTRVAVMSMMILFAYVGQFAHRNAHMSKKMRPQWVQTLQSMSILIPGAAHAKHHKTYDDNFPILNGITSPFFSFAVKRVTNRWAWVAAFFAIGFLDSLVIARLVSLIAGL